MAENKEIWYGISWYSLDFSTSFSAVAVYWCYIYYSGIRVKCWEASSGKIGICKDFSR